MENPAPDAPSENASSGAPPSAATAGARAAATSSHGSVPSAASSETAVDLGGVAADRYRRLQHLASELAQALSARDVVDVIVHQGIEGMGAIAGGVLAVDEEADRLRLLHAVGFPDPILEPYRTFPIDTRTPAGLAVLTGSAVFIDSPHDWAERFGDVPRTRGPSGGGAYAALPIRARGTVIGALTLVFPDSLRFGSEEQAFLNVLADHCAHALDRAQLYDEAVSANRARSEFLGAVSHELRTPLGAAMGYAELLREEVVGPLNARQKEFVDRVQANNRRLLRLIEDVLEFNATGMVAATGTGSRSVAVVVEEALGRARAAIGVRSVAIRAELGVHADQPIGAPDEVVDILARLARNALGAVEVGEVTLSVGSDGERLLFRVRDGRRPPADPALLFEPFPQGLRDGEVDLSLPIAQRIARSLGGGLTAEARPDGFTLTLWLPE